jgi:hypothetical protein
MHLLNVSFSKEEQTTSMEQRISRTSGTPFVPVKRDASSAELVERKVEELVELLNTTQLDKHTASAVEKQINDALKNHLSTKDQIKSFQNLAADGQSSRLELLEGMDQLLSISNIDTETGKKFIRQQLFKGIVKFLIGLTLIITGFAMIVLPAPPYFEMFTIFYFTHDDGITIMDLISLLVVLCGVFLVIVSFNKNEHPARFS